VRRESQGAFLFTIKSHHGINERQASIK